MSKKPVKISREQINKIRTLARSGKTIAQIHSETKIASHIVRYRVEREKLSQLNEMTGQKVLGGEISLAEETKDDRYYERIIEDLKDKNRKLVEMFVLH